MFKEYKSAGIAGSIIKAMQFTNENKDRVYRAIECRKSACFEEDHNINGDIIDIKPILMIEDVFKDKIIVRLNDWIVEEKEADKAYYIIKDEIFKKRYKLT